MFILQALESLLGSVEIWPTLIIRNLFFDEPNSTNIKRLSAFFYRNGIPFYIASYFFYLCNNRTNSYVNNIMENYYFQWQISQHTPHMAICYNTGCKKFCWINGRCLAQLEPIVSSPVSSIPIGWEEGTSYSMFVRIKLRHP
jgi:hypothetical protein